jgi:proteasome lid subunit RPN8/RPN11
MITRERSTRAVRISPATLAAMQSHALDSYPNECCGIIVERDGGDQAVRVSNIQDELHEKDPEQFPRTARTAYAMGGESAPILLAAERRELSLLAFYHSHPEHDAYFSEEDRKQAFGGWDEPNYPDAAQLVISVYGREVKDVAAFVWDERDRDFVRVDLLAGEPRRND